MAAPRKALDPGWQQRIDDQLFGYLSLDQRALACRRVQLAGVAKQCLHGVLQVAEGCGHAPDAQRRTPAPEPCKRQLHLHAALVADEFMPLVDNDHPHAAKHLMRIGTRQQKRQALGRSDQHGRQSLVLRIALGRCGVAAACAEGPVGRQSFEWLDQCAKRVSGQSTHRGDPQHGQWRCGWWSLCKCRPHRRFRRCRWRWSGCARRYGERLECAQPHRVGLAGAGGGMQQSGLASGDGLPDVALEFEGLPAARCEPGDEVGRGHEVVVKPNLMTATTPPAFATCPPLQSACLPASAACAGSAPQCRFYGACSSRCLQSPARTSASA